MTMDVTIGSCRGTTDEDGYIENYFSAARVETLTRPDAPSPPGSWMAPRVNAFGMNNPSWERFFERQPIMREVFSEDVPTHVYPHAFKITEIDREHVRGALAAHREKHPDIEPAFKQGKKTERELAEMDLAILEWFAWWIDYALKAEGTPTVEVTC